MTFEILERFPDGSPEWLEQRRHGIGASDVAAVLGESPFSTPYRVWLDKIGQRWDAPKGEHLEWGHRLEPAIAQWVADHHPEVGQVCDGIDVASVEYPWLTAKPDRVIVPDGARDTLIPLELKTSSEWMSGEWDTIPPHYLLQVLTQCIVLGADRGYLAALIGGHSTRFFEVIVSEHQSKVERIITETEKFWQRVTALDPPPVTDVKEAMHRWQGGGGAVTCDLELYDLLGKHTIAKADEKEAREAADALKVEILKRIENDELIVTPTGEKLATYRPQSGRKSVDLKRLERAYPDVYADVVSIGEPVRVLRVDTKKLMEE